MEKFAKPEQVDEYLHQKRASKMNPEGKRVWTPFLCIAAGRPVMVRHVAFKLSITYILVGVILASLSLAFYGWLGTDKIWSWVGWWVAGHSLFCLLPNIIWFIFQVLGNHTLKI